MQGNQAFSYDANGNLLQEGATKYAYDAADNLVRTEEPTLLLGLPIGPPKVTTFAYNGDDARVSRNTGGRTTRWLQDVVADLPVALRETTTGGWTEQRDYTWGNELLSQEATQGSGGWQALLPDGLGSIRALTNVQGQITNTYDYDAFGNDRAPQTSRATSYGFAGEPVDPSTGLTYLRARYYDPITGRFTARDNLVQGGPGTQGFDRYTYANNNPVNWTDPSGQFLDTIADIGFIGYDAYRLVKDGKKNRKKNLAAFGADVGGALIPGATGAGLAVRAASKADDVGKAASKGDDVGKAAKVPRERSSKPGRTGKRPTTSRGPRTNALARIRTFSTRRPWRTVAPTMSTTSSHYYMTLT